MVKRLILSPDSADDRKPFLGIGVAVIVLAQAHAEHIELGLVPAGDDVEAEPAVTDVIGGRDLLCGEDRVDQRRVDGAKEADLLGMGQQASRPSDGLERFALGRNFIAVITVPAGDR